MCGPALVPIVAGIAGAEAVNAVAPDVIGGSPTQKAMGWIDAHAKAPSYPGGQALPAQTPPPKPEPVPTMIGNINDNSEQIRLRRLQALRMGMASTIKTGVSGITAAPTLLTPTATPGTGKTKLGQ